MSATETLTLAKSLEPTIGEEAMTNLISFIEEYKHESLATKDDLKVLEIRLLKEINDVRKEVNDVRKEVNEVRKEVNEVRKEVSELRKEMIEIRKDMNANTWKIIGSTALLLSIFSALIKLVPYG